MHVPWLQVAFVKLIARGEEMDEQYLQQLLQLNDDLAAQLDKYERIAVEESRKRRQLSYAGGESNHPASMSARNQYVSGGAQGHGTPAMFDHGTSTMSNQGTSMPSMRGSPQTTGVGDAKHEVDGALLNLEFEDAEAKFRDECDDVDGGESEEEQLRRALEASVQVK